jgi:hypothetical protein
VVDRVVRRAFGDGRRKVYGWVGPPGGGGIKTRGSRPRVEENGLAEAEVHLGRKVFGLVWGPRVPLRSVDDRPTVSYLARSAFT